MSNSDEITTYGPWEKDRVLGFGGFGIVTLWRNGDKYIALKKCRWDFAGSEVVSKKQKERWTKEVDIMKRLSHPNVVRSITLPGDFSTMRSELPILSMEFCALGDLRKVLNRPENCCGLQEIEVRQLITDIKNAVQYLHSEKITHRDLKPENIVLQPDADTPGEIIYKLIDLGYAKELDQSSICNSFVGTLQYLAPELFLNKDYTSSVDYWSLGLVSHEAITGIRPFLPTMPPTQWMMYVEKKRANEICAYQRVDDDKIVFKNELFKENCISDYLKAQLEKWLAVTLQWDPRKRGRGPDNELVVFSMIDDIFCKKIVLIFCVNAYKKLSYEVDSATAVSTLKGWIERDVNQPSAEQILLLPSGEVLSDDKRAIDCWDPSNQEIMLYVLPKTGLKLPSDVKPYYPDLVQFLLKNGKTPVEYAMQKRIWANAVYFMRQELFLYQIFLDAYAVKMNWLQLCYQRIGSLYKDICASHEGIKATHTLVEKSLHCDERFFRPVVEFTRQTEQFVVTAPQQKQQFSRLERLVALQIEKLKEEHNQIGRREDTIRNLSRNISSVKSRFENLQLFLEPGRTKIPEMENLVKSGKRLYLILMKQRREQQNVETPAMKLGSLDMLKLIYNFLKVRDMALNDEEFSSHLNELTVFEGDLLAIEQPLKATLVDLNSSLGRITNCQLRRQEEFWKMVSELCRKNQVQHNNVPPTMDTLKLPTQKLEQPNQNDEIVCTEVQKTPIPEFVISEPCNNIPFGISSNGVNPLSNGIANHSTSQLDSNVIFSENERLRCDFLDCMAEAHEKYQSILKESLSMDWNSLCKEIDP